MSNASHPPISESCFLNVVRPHLQTGDAACLAQAVRVRWRPAQVSQLLRQGGIDTRRVAALVLGLIGNKASSHALTRALRDEDAQVNLMAEHALWSIWFRAGAPEATESFREGVALLESEAYEAAIICFTKASTIDLDFAEAHNQCAIAHYFLAQWPASIQSCCKAIRLNPVHFGAISGLGHVYAQTGDLTRALRCYRRSLSINPRMPVIERATKRLESRINDMDSSGEFLVQQTQ